VLHFGVVSAKSFRCYLSCILVCNEVPEDPVLSPVSNHVFERRLITKFIQQNGTDPINGEHLTEDQLLDIKGAGVEVEPHMGFLSRVDIFSF